MCILEWWRVYFVISLAQAVYATTTIQAPVHTINDTPKRGSYSLILERERVMEDSQLGLNDNK